MLTALTTHKQRKVILTVTFGNILEWYDIYCYAYLAPIIAKVFFNFDSSLYSLLGTFIIFGSGFLARPFGAIIFGRIGDLMGRKKAFLLSIILLTIPTFLIGCLPTYAQVGILAPILLSLFRILQSIPAAGEVPGTFCFLYENASQDNQKYMASWTAVGNQIGAVVGLGVTCIVDQLMPETFRLSWGWRIPFWIGGLIGIFGIYLRYHLRETPVFKKLKDQSEIDSNMTINVIKKYKGKIALGTAFGVLNASTYYLAAIYIPSFLNTSIGLSYNQNIIVSFSILVLTTITLPIFGIIGEKLNNKTMLIVCAVAIIILLYPLNYSINEKKLILLSGITLIYIILISAMTSLISYQLPHLYSASIRYTGVALAFNLADGVVGAFTPAAAILLLQFTGDQAAFCWYIFICAIISLISFFKIKK